MGLLDVLDYHYNHSAEKSIEVEYRLVSWGEIYPPFLGDREHSLSAQFILNDYPFKLFSVTIPYSGLPQKLCLTFRYPVLERRTEKITSISPHPDDAAKEYAAFLSLVTRRRVFAIGQTRNDGVPFEGSAEIYYRSHFQEKQQLKEIDPEEIYLLLKNLHGMDRRIAQQYLLSMRLYHSAIEMMYTEPEFAYSFLVMSLESIASAVYKDMKLSDTNGERSELEQYIDSAYPHWREYCDISSVEKKKQVADMLVDKAYFIVRKFREFVFKNLPDAFWSDTEDDAKPDYLSSIITAGSNGMGKEEYRRADKTIQEFEKIDKASLKKTLDRIYNARSKFVHEGIRFPLSIVIGHFSEIPMVAVEELFDKSFTKSGRNELFLDVPPLLTFERMVSYSLIGFLSNQALDKKG